MNQFKEGLNSLGNLWTLVLANQEICMPLFVYREEKLTAAIIKNLTKINWTESDRPDLKLLEEDSIYCWELFLQHCESKCNIY